MGLKVENLAISRGVRLLQNEVTFELAANEALWLRGANGVGKSTLLEALCGLRMPRSGTISWQGDSIDAQLDQYHDQLAYTGHKNGNNDTLTCEAALRFYAGIYASDRLADALRKMGLENRKDIQVRYLSAGQQKRLSLARLLLRDVPLWILDEPGVSLDSEGADLLGELITKHLTQGGMAIFTSHTKLPVKARELKLKPITSMQSSKSNPFLSEEWGEVT